MNNNNIFQINIPIGELINNKIKYNMNNIQIPNLINRDMIDLNEWINIGFKFNYTDGPREFFINANKNSTINELLNLYLKKKYVRICR